MTDVPIIKQGELARLDGRSSGELARLCSQCTDFFELVHGQPGGPSTADEILGPLPSHVTSGHKHIFGIYSNGELEGIAELLEGYPTTMEWYVGLLVLRPESRANGLGTSVWESLHAWIRAREGSTIRLVVQKQNPRARRFWERNGFEVESEILDRPFDLENSAWKLRLSMQPAAQQGVARTGPRS